MKKYEGLRALYVGSHPLFTEGASAVHSMSIPKFAIAWHIFIM